MASEGVDKFHDMAVVDFSTQARDVDFNDVAESLPVVVIKVARVIPFWKSRRAGGERDTPRLDIPSE